jgi:hypothetical protein
LPPKLDGRRVCKGKGITIMLVLLTIALLVALFGVFKPFKGFQRKHFGMAAAGLFVACLIATPTPEGTKGQQIAGAAPTPPTPAEKMAPATEGKISFDKKPATEVLSVAAESIEEDAGEALTGPQRNAVRSAEQYLSMSGFSRKGLIEQLSSDAGDGYAVSDATIAVDSLSVDWNENAAKSARQYLDMTGFSCKGLIEQLSSDAGSGYTASQAAYGARQAGAC